MSRIQWPDGKKIAVNLSFDVDAETAFTNSQENINKLSALSMGTYGRTVGLNRILKLLKEYDTPATFFVPGAVAEIDPIVLERIVGHGHPVGYHGYFHERLDEITPEQEEAILAKGTDLFKKYTGSHPLGYRAPLWEINPGTPELLKRYGYRFDSSLMGDDIPYTIDAGNDKLFEVPVSWLLDDWEQFAYSAKPRFGYVIEEPDKVFRLWKEEFDAQYEEGGCFTLTMHPQATGKASRMKMLENFIQYMRGKSGVWFTTIHEIEKQWSNGNIQVNHIPFPDIASLYKTNINI